MSFSREITITIEIKELSIKVYFFEIIFWKYKILKGSNNKIVLKWGKNENIKKSEQIIYFLFNIKKIKNIIKNNENPDRNLIIKYSKNKPTVINIKKKK